MKSPKPVEASDIINRICSALQYSRAHVAKMLRDHAQQLKAQKIGGRWMIPQSSAERLRQLVAEKSGPRYKLGETGPNAA